MNQAETKSDVQLAVFQLDGQPYAIDIEKIKQIIRPLKITKLPRAPSFVEGVIDLRGVVLPVVDMRKRFSLPSRGEAESKDDKIIIVSVAKKIVGIVVDDVTEVIPMAKNEIQPPPRVVKGVEANYLKGVCRYHDQILMILNLDELLTAEEKIQIAAIEKSPTDVEERNMK